jgi:hypothetical protein
VRYLGVVMVPKQWKCKHCGFLHPGQHVGCTWCDKARRIRDAASRTSPPRGRAPAAATAAATGTWSDVAVAKKGRSRGRAQQPPAPSSPVRGVAVAVSADRSWINAVAHRPHVGPAAVSAANGTLDEQRLSRSNAWTALSDADDVGPDEVSTPAVALAEAAAAKEVLRVARVAKLSGLVDMRKHLEHGAQSDFQSSELLAVNERITILEHECHGAKPLRKQQQSLATRLKKAQATLADCVEAAEVARIASELAAQAYLASSLLVASQEDSVAELASMLDTVVHKMQAEAAAALPTVDIVMDTACVRPVIAEAHCWLLDDQRTAYAALLESGFIAALAGDASATGPPPLRVDIGSPERKRRLTPGSATTTHYSEIVDDSPVASDAGSQPCFGVAISPCSVPWPVTSDAYGPAIVKARPMPSPYVLGAPAVRPPVAQLGVGASDGASVFGEGAACLAEQW